jgi:hypothetical protein
VEAFVFRFEEGVMEQRAVMANKPTDVKVLVVRDSSESSRRETTMGGRFPSMNEMIGDALAKLESEGCALLNIRYSAIPLPDGGYEHFAMLIGRLHATPVLPEID